MNRGSGSGGAGMAHRVPGDANENVKQRLSAVWISHSLLSVYLQDKGNVGCWEQSAVILRPFPVKGKKKTSSLISRGSVDAKLVRQRHI